QADSGMGKTRLLNEYSQIAREVDLPCTHPPFTLARQINVEQFLLSTSTYFGDRGKFPKFTDVRTALQKPNDLKEYYSILGKSLLVDISNFQENTCVMLLIDKYENGDEVLQHWLAEDFISEVAPPYGSSSARRQLVLVIAGTEKPKVPPSTNSILE